MLVAPDLPQKFHPGVFGTLFGRAPNGEWSSGQLPELVGATQPNASAEVRGITAGIQDFSEVVRLVAVACAPISEPARGVIKAEEQRFLQ